MAKKISKDKNRGAGPGRSIKFQFADKTAERYLSSQLSKAEKLYEASQYAEALKLLEPLPARYPGQPRLLEMLGLVYAQSGALAEARDTLEEAFQLAPGETGRLAQFNLAQVYALTGFTFLAYQQSQLLDCYALARETKQPATLDRCRQFQQDAQTLVEKVAAQQGRTLDQFREVGLALDNGRLALTRQDLKAARQFFLKAVDLEPSIAAAHNNLALVYLLDNQLAEATRQAEYVLTQLDEQNRNALSTLVRLKVIEQQTDQANQYLQRLLALPSPIEADDVVKLAEAQAALENDQAIFELVAGLLNSAEMVADLDSAAYQEMITFGVVAAANLGHIGVALKFLREALPFTRPTLLERTLFGLENNERGPRAGGRFFYYDPLTAYPPAAAYFQQVLLRLADSETLDYQESLRTFFVEYGQSALEVAAYKFWIDREPAEVADLLAQAVASGAAGTVEMVRRLAFTRAGDDLQRLTAARVLLEHGLLEPDQPLKIWLGQRLAAGSLEKLIALYQRLNQASSASQGHQYDHQTAVQLNEGLELMQRGDRVAAIAHYRRIIEANPSVKQAYQNLAALLSGQGNLAGAIGYLELALKIDPEYLHARIALAQLQLADNRLAEAEAELAQLASRLADSPYLDELEAYLAARVSLYQRQKRPADVQAALAELLKLDPANEWAAAFMAEPEPALPEIGQQDE